MIFTSATSARLPVWRSLLRRLGRLAGWTSKAVALLVAVYLLAILVGLIPVNNAFEASDNGVEIFVVSTAVHADIIVPVANDVMDWREFFAAADVRADVSRRNLIAMGWGEKNFYLNTPTWADLKASTVAQALFWPSEPCMHISYTHKNRLSDQARSVRISESQYRELVGYLKKSFRQTAEGRPIRVDADGYGESDAFYESSGNYHVMNTCNSWVGRGLQAAGVRTGWSTPLPKSPTLFF